MPKFWTIQKPDVRQFSVSGFAAALKPSAFYRWACGPIVFYQIISSTCALMYFYVGMTNGAKWTSGTLIGGSPDAPWAHQPLPHDQDPCQASQSQSPPLDHICVFIQGWKIKAHGFMGTQWSNWRDTSMQHPLWNVGNPSRRKWWGQSIIGGRPTPLWRL